MQDDPRETAARRAIDAGDWQTARDLYETLARATNAPEAWAGLAEAAWLQQDSKLMIDARLTAYRLHRERGNDIAAARMAIALGNDFLDFRGDAPSPTAGSSMPGVCSSRCRRRRSMRGSTPGRRALR